MMQYSGLTLAYLGDAIYEVMIREYLIKQGDTKVDTLHSKAIHYTSAEGQAKAYDLIETMLTEEEIQVYKRGRNAKTDRKARSASLAEYKKATGFEAIIGYLHLLDRKDRLSALLQTIVDKI